MNILYNVYKIKYGWNIYLNSFMFVIDGWGENASCSLSLFFYHTKLQAISPKFYS